MARFAAITLGLILALFALLVGVVFSQRRVFADGSLIVFEMGHQTYRLYSVQPTSGFGKITRTLFNPQIAFDDRYVSGIDCAPDRRALVFWYVFLYRLDLDSDNLTRLVLGAGLSQQSAWSPDGARIAFLDDIADRQPREIFTIRADGSDKTQVTANSYQETSLAWSPDGANIAFTYRQGDGTRREGLAVADVASGASPILYEADARVGHAAWSPDGSRIAFDKSDGDRTDIYTIQPDGSGLTRLPGVAAQNIIPHWSPDGSMISFSARDPGGSYQLYVMNSDGGDPYLVFFGVPGEDVFNRCWLST